MTASKHPFQNAKHYRRADSAKNSDNELPTGDRGDGLTPSPPIWSRAGIELRWRGAYLMLGDVSIGWVDTHPDGWQMRLERAPNRSFLGTRPSEQECRAALVDAAVKALMGEVNGDPR